MTVSYRRLIAEHEEIGAAATALLARAARDDAGAAELAAALDALARTVHDHVAAEDIVVARVDRTGVPASWRALWVEGRAAFEALRTDWLTFIARWTAVAIARDPRGFRADADAMLGRLRVRLREESDTWYAVALQGAAITLH